MPPIARIGVVDERLWPKEFKADDDTVRTFYFHCKYDFVLTGTHQRKKKTPSNVTLAWIIVMMAAFRLTISKGMQWWSTNLIFPVKVQPIALIWSANVTTKQVPISSRIHEGKGWRGPLAGDLFTKQKLQQSLGEWCEILWTYANL